MGVLGGGWTMESGGGQGRGGWIKESVNLVSVGGWVCVCVGVLSVGLGFGWWVDYGEWGRAGPSPPGVGLKSQ